MTVLALHTETPPTDQSIPVPPTRKAMDTGMPHTDFRSIIMPHCESRTADTAMSNKRLVLDHFEEFVTRRDLAAIDRNMVPDFLDHDGPGGRPTGIEGDRAMMQAMHRMMPDLRVEVRDAVAEGDKVAVRNVWTATDPKSGRPAEFHGFVLWRIQDGKIAERWATVTPLHELAASSLEW